MKNVKTPILVIDDDFVIRELLSAWLCDDHEVLTAENGEEGVKVYHKYHNVLHAVITDIRMPGIQGDEVVNQIRNHSDKVPIVIITGYANEIDLSDALRKPKVKLIAKPFRVEEVLETIKEMAKAK